MKKLFLITLGVLISICPGLVAQKSTPFADKTEDEGKIKVKLDFPSEGRTSKKGAGYSTNVDLLDPKPKKVALVSFYLYDPGSGKSSSVGAVAVTGKSKAAVWRTPDALAQTHIDGFFAQSIEPMKEGFKEFGIELLTPDEFLDTEEKKEFFYGFNQESGKKEKTKTKAIGMNVYAEISNIKICPYDEGYRPFFVINEGMPTGQKFANTGIGGANRKMTSSLGYELAKGLDVDAVVVCYIVSTKLKMNKENYAVNAVAMYMFGPNPLAEGPDDKNRGQFYCGARFYNGLLEFSNSKSGTSYDNMGNVMNALAKKNANWVINRAKK